MGAYSAFLLVMVSDRPPPREIRVLHPGTRPKVYTGGRIAYGWRRRSTWTAEEAGTVAMDHGRTIKAAVTVGVENRFTTTTTDTRMVQLLLSQAAAIGGRTPSSRRLWWLCIRTHARLALGAVGHMASSRFEAASCRTESHVTSIIACRASSSLAVLLDSGIELQRRAKG